MEKRSTTHIYQKVLMLIIYIVQTIIIIYVIIYLIIYLLNERERERERKSHRKPTYVLCHKPWNAMGISPDAPCLPIKQYHSLK
jgi:hypothetical protein